MPVETSQTKESSIPLHFRLINGIGRSLRSVGVKVGLDEESLCQSAARQTGLSDFGDDYFRAGLRKLVESLESDANLTTIGRLGHRLAIIQQLSNRLKLVEMGKQVPELFIQSILPPLIVIGIPRSGTTLLHRLLAADPAGRAIPLWELSSPLPAGREAHLLSDSADRTKRRKRMEWQMRIRRGLDKDLDRKHFIRAETPEECMFMLGMTFHTMLYWVTAPVYGYVDWYGRQPRDEKYADYRRLLQVLQAVDPTRRLVLKAPAHTGGLGELLENVPEAMVVQTHRDPVTCLNSLNSLLATTHGVVSEQLDVRKMAEANLTLLAEEQRRNAAGRQKFPGQVLDVSYKDLVADPLGTVRGIYDHYELDYSAEFEAEMARYLAENPKGKHGQHRYNSADFGLTDEEIRERLQVIEFSRA